MTSPLNRRALPRLAAALALVAGAAPASAWPVHGASVSALCPQGTGWGDGCAGAPADGVVQFKRSQFFDTSTTGYVQDGVARQSGQAPYASKPFYNMAGVDFKVAYSAAAFTGKAPSGIASDTANVCSYSATGSNTGGPLITCDNSSATFTAQGYDFGPNGPSGACVPIKFGPNFSGTAIFKNDNFLNDPNCMDQGYLVQTANNSSVNMQIIQDKIDGGALNAENLVSEIDSFELLNTTGTLTVRYSAFLHSTGRPIATQTTGSIDAEYNYVEGFIYGSPNAQSLHGEFIVESSPVASGTMPFYTNLNNTILQPANVRAATVNGFAGGTNAPLWMTAQNITIASYTAKYNTTIVNLSGGPGGSRVAGTSLIEYQNQPVTGASISYNYTDSTGAAFSLHSATVTGTPSWLSGNVCLTTGAAISAWEGDC